MKTDVLIVGAGLAAGGDQDADETFLRPSHDPRSLAAPGQTGLRLGGT